MQRLIVEIESAAKARELQSLLSELKFVRNVTAINDEQGLPQAAYESDEAFFTEIERRTKELESGAVKGLSIEELEAGARALQSRRRA